MTEGSEGAAPAAATGAEAAPAAEVGQPTEAPELAGPLRAQDTIDAQTGIAEWGQDPSGARLALLALAGVPGSGDKVYDAAFQAARFGIEQHRAPQGVPKPKGLKNIPGWGASLIGGLFTVGSRDAQDHAVQYTLDEARKSGEKSAEFNKTGAEACMDILRSGTPEMQALALEIQIEAANRLARGEKDDDKKEKMQGKIKGFESERDEIRTEDGNEVPSQLQPMAENIAKAFVDGENIPEEMQAAIDTDPIGFMQEKLGLMLSDEGLKKQGLDKMEKAGLISAEGRAQLEDMDVIEYKDTQERINEFKKERFKSKVDNFFMGGIIAFFMLYHQNMKDKQAAAQSAGRR